MCEMSERQRGRAVLPPLRSPAPSPTLRSLPSPDHFNEPEMPTTHARSSQPSAEAPAKSAPSLLPAFELALRVRAYLAENDEERAERRLSDALALLRPLLEPQIRAIVNNMGWFEPPGARDDDVVDLCQEARLRLVAELRGVRHRLRKPIRDLKAYATACAYHDYVRLLEERHPRRASLKGRVCYLLVRWNPDDPVSPIGFARWRRGPEWIAGFAAWAGRSAASSPAGRCQRLREDLEAISQARAVPGPEASLSQVLTALFNWYDAPVQLEYLVSLLVELRGERDPVTTSLDDDPPGTEETSCGRTRLEQLPDIAPTPEEKLLGKEDEFFGPARLLEHLRWIGAALTNLSPDQLRALLLALPGAVLVEFPLQGIASLSVLAKRLGLPGGAEQLAGLLPEMPLSDAQIAALFEKTPAAVAVRRSEARKKLLELWHAFRRREPGEEESP